MIQQCNRHQGDNEQWKYINASNVKLSEVKDYATIYALNFL